MFTGLSSENDVQDLQQILRQVAKHWPRRVCDCCKGPEAFVLGKVLAGKNSFLLEKVLPRAMEEMSMKLAADLMTSIVGGRLSDEARKDTFIFKFVGLEKREQILTFLTDIRRDIRQGGDALMNRYELLQTPDSALAYRNFSLHEARRIETTEKSQSSRCDEIKAFWRAW